MKKIISKLLLSFCLISTILIFTSCENFLKSDSVKSEIEEMIAYNNAKEIPILIQPEEGTGSTVPVGNNKVKMGYGFDISFSENPAYSFVKWIAVTNDASRTPVTEGVVFEDEASPATKIIVTNETASIRIIPLCEQRIAISGEPSPRYEPLGVSRDRSIIVSFTKPLSKSSFIFTQDEIPQGASVKKDDNGEIWAYILDKKTYFKNISITNIDNYSIAQYFLRPEVDGKLLTIRVDKTNPIEFNSGEIYKTVKVTLSKDITDTSNISMNASRTWNYQITESTDEKATVSLTSVAAEGLVYLAGTRDYSLGQKITLSFTEDAEYQFVKWEYDSNVIYVAEPEKLNTTGVVLEKTTEDNPTQIKAVCAPRLRVSSFSPQNDTSNPSASKNSSIVITFNHYIPDEEEDLEQLKNISITLGGAPVKSSFYAPSVSANTITYIADNSNMIDVPTGQKKTISVTIPSDFYYKLNDGTKVTYGGNGITFDYKIDETTFEKTNVRFSTDDAAISGKQIRVDGTYLSSGSGKSMSVGQVWELEYQVTDGYGFAGWKLDVPVSGYTVSTNNYKNSGNISVYYQDPQTLQNKLYFVLEMDKDTPQKATIYSYDAVASGTSGYGITVSARDIIIPVVESVKINNTMNIFYTSTNVCDSKIYINFNKEIDTSTVTFDTVEDDDNGKEFITLSSAGPITITKEGVSTSHYEDYFAAEWSNGNKTLILSPILSSGISIKKLVPNDSDIFSFVIKLNANGDIKDTTGYPVQLSSGINNSFEIGYRIRGQREDIAPVWSNAVVRKSSIGKEIDNTAFDNWNTDQTIWGNHHLRNSFYFSMKGIDEGSGIGYLLVTETLKKSTNGEDVDSSPVSTMYEPTGVSSSLYTIEGVHKFKSINDGILQIDFTLVDKAGNESDEVVTYYVIKDTQLAIDSEFNNKIWIPFEDKRYDSLHEEKDGLVETVYFTVPSDKYMLDVYKVGNTSVYQKAVSKSVLWSYDVNNFEKDHEVQRDSNGNCQLTHDPSRITYLQVYFRDNVGNEKTFIRFIPAMPEINAESFELKTSIHASNRKLYQIIPNNMNFYESLVQKYNMDPNVTVLYFRNNNVVTVDGKEFFKQKDKTPFELLENLGDGIPEAYFEGLKPNTDYYFNFCIVNGLAGDYEGSRFVSSLSDSTLLIRKNSSGTIIVKQGSLKYGAPPTAETISGCYPSSLDIISITPNNNTGNCKVIINSKFERNQNYSYKLQAINTQTNAVIDVEETKGFVADLPTPANYNIRLVLTNKEHQVFYTAPLGLTIKNPNDDVYVVSDSTIQLKPDCTAPTFNGQSLWGSTFPFAYNIMYSDYGFGNNVDIEVFFTYPRDETEMYKNSDGKGELTYWILPYSNNGSVWGSDFSEEDYTDSKKTITYDCNQINYILPHNSKHQVRIELPYDGLDEGYYTICIKAKDANGNYSYEFQKIFNKLLNTKLLYEVSDNKITFTNPHNGGTTENGVFYYLDTEDNHDNAPIRWIYAAQAWNIHQNPTFNIPESLVGRWGRIVVYKMDKGYFDMEYVYIDYLLKKELKTKLFLIKKIFLPD